MHNARAHTNTQRAHTLTFKHTHTHNARTHNARTHTNTHKRTYTNTHTYTHTHTQNIKQRNWYAEVFCNNFCAYYTSNPSTLYFYFFFYKPLIGGIFCLIQCIRSHLLGFSKRYLKYIPYLIIVERRSLY